MIPEFTIVLGVDRKHLDQLRMTWPTWVKHKNGIKDTPVVMFYDRESLDRQTAACFATTELNCNLSALVEWPSEPTDYGQGTCKWDAPQRHKMLAGFCHVPAQYCTTPYYLKLDTDVIGLKEPAIREWIVPEWFDSHPWIVGPGWGFTRPPNQMLELDKWADTYDFFPEDYPPLGLTPEVGADKLKHQRIAGWCNFFSMDLTRWCASTSRDTVGPCRLPVPSWDGFSWYAATRWKQIVRRVSMKDRGWGFWHTFDNIQKAAERAMA